MKGNPAMPGGQSKSKPTRLSALWVFDRVGFFIFGGLGHGPEDAGVLPEEES
jgi:hypothetical protein